MQPAAGRAWTADSRTGVHRGVRAACAMRTALVLLTALSADGGSPVATRPAEYAEARRAFGKAIQAGALDDARSALERRRAAAPGRIDLIYDLACIEARAGRANAAFATLEPLSTAGLSLDPAADPDLAPLHADPRWTAFLARFTGSRAPVRPGGTEVEVPAQLELVEDLARDPRTGAVFVTSVRKGEVWRRLSGTWGWWIRPGPPGSGAFALGLDPARGVIHVTVAALPHVEGFRKQDQGPSALVT